MATDLLKEKTNKVLLSMSLPISIGMLSTFLFQVIDTYFVGKLGANALAALSFASTVYFLVVGLFIGLAVGVSIIIGESLGAGNKPKMYKTIKVGIVLCLALSISISLFFITFIQPIFTFLGATEEILPLIKQYMIPLLCGIPLLTVGLLIGSVLRATGNVSKPEILMAVAGVINLVFDYGLIFGKLGLPAWGIRGAAYATVLSWIFVIIGMLYLLLKDRLLRIKEGKDHKLKKILSEIQKLSTPTIITQIIGPLTLMYLTFLLAKQSSIAVAAFGVAGRIETLLMIGIWGVSTALTPFIAQNKGAKSKIRVEEAIAFGGRASTYLGLFMVLILFLFIKPIATLFSENAEIVGYTSNYFYIVSLSYVLYGLYIITTSIFNGLSLTLNSLKISLVKSIAFTIPLTLIGSLWGVLGIFIGLSFSNVLAGLYAAYEMKKDFKRVGSKLAEVNIWNEYRNDLKKLFSRQTDS